MKAWLKLMVKLRNDGKWIRLSDLESKVWIQALLCARMAEDACSIPGPADIALELHREDSAVEAAFARLASIGWLALDETGWTVPKFAEVQGDEKDRDLARIRKARQREKSRCVTVCHDESRVTDPLSRCVTVGHDESRVTDPLSRCVTVCHALEERRLEEMRGDISTANAVSPPLPGEPDIQATEKSGVIPPAKRDATLAEFYDVYRFAWCKKGRDETFWGRNKIAEGYRTKARAILKAFGKPAMQGIAGELLNPYWRSEGTYGLANACRANVIEAGIARWKRQPEEWRNRFEAEFEAWRAANVKVG